mgnify:CR=1 FL=1
MSEAIQSYFKDIEDNEIVLFIVPEVQLPQIEKDIIKYVSQQGYYIVYVNANKPYTTMTNIFQKEGIVMDKIFFVDLVTNLVGINVQRAGNCVFCPPQALTNLSITIKSVVESLPKEANKILFLDSISTLLLYNESVTVTRFAHALIAKLREWKVKGMMLTLEQEADKKLISQITSFADKCVSIK